VVGRARRGRDREKAAGKVDDDGIVELDEVAFIVVVVG
jgi:hypothetical protein